MVPNEPTTTDRKARSTKRERNCKATIESLSDDTETNESKTRQREREILRNRRSINNHEQDYNRRNFFRASIRRNRLRRRRARAQLHALHRDAARDRLNSCATLQGDAFSMPVRLPMLLFKKRLATERRRAYAWDKARPQRASRDADATDAILRLGFQINRIILGRGADRDSKPR